MMDRIKQKIAGLILFFAGNFLLIQAQPSLQTAVDKNQLLIGGRLKLTVQASFKPDGYFVRWITVPDSLQHFELIEKTKVDSVFINGKLTGLAQVFTLTSFDSGKWALPSFNVKFNSAKGDTTLNLFSDSLPVSVAFQLDTTTALRDIKAIREVELPGSIWYWVVGGITLLLLVLAGAWLYLRRKNGRPFITIRSSLPPFRQAIIELRKLKKLNHLAPIEIKIYHTRLAEILRHYLSAKTGVDYSSKTTGDILILLKENSPDKEHITKVSAALRCSDAVKFAKYLPEQYESEVSLQSIQQLIEITEQSNSHTK